MGKESQAGETTPVLSQMPGRLVQLWVESHGQDIVSAGRGAHASYQLAGEEGDGTFLMSPQSSGVRWSSHI